MVEPKKQKKGNEEVIDYEIKDLIDPEQMFLSILNKLKKDKCGTFRNTLLWLGIKFIKQGKQNVTVTDLRNEIFWDGSLSYLNKVFSFFVAIGILNNHKRESGKGLKGFQSTIYTLKDKGLLMDLIKGVKEKDESTQSRV